MGNGKLGFGLMRLPQLSAEPADIDYGQLNKMVDLFLEAGFDYFDTSWAYHNGGSEAAVKTCLADRYPRERYRLASKLPTFAITEEPQVEEIFEQQRARCGVEYFDYYLLHNVNELRYDRVIRETHMFDYMKKWKKEGKIRHIAFSYHDNAEALDRILTEHPEVEAVQIALNYIDWNAYFVQAQACYDVIRRHGRQVIIMEPVKGGMLAAVPTEAEKQMKAENPDASPASWALRYGADLDGVVAVLSGMSNLEQVRDNVSCMKNFQPLNGREKEILQRAARIYRESGPAKTADFTAYEAFAPKGVSAAAILDCYNSCMLQPVPTFAAEHNYFASEKARRGLSWDDLCIPGEVILEDGTDATELVHRAEAFLNENAFFRPEG